MNSWILRIVFLSIIWLISSCRSENEEEYFKLFVASQTCDTAAVTYTNQMKPIFDAQCYSCHTGGAVSGCDLDSYENVVKYISNNQPGDKLYDYIKNNDHQGVILDTCSLKQFAKWIKNPAP